MSDADPRLDALWAATRAPIRDLVFELGVEQAIARRRLAADAALAMAASVAAVAGLAAVGPSLVSGAGALVTSFDPAGPVLAAVAALAAAMAWLSRVPEEG